MIAVMVKRDPSTIRKWAVRHPDRLPRRGTDERGRTLYSIDDALALAATLATRNNPGTVETTGQRMPHWGPALGFVCPGNVSA